MDSNTPQSNQRLELGMSLDNVRRELVENISNSCPDIRAIWLIGSRANGTDNAFSDWDFIAFGSENSLEYLKVHCELHLDSVDFLVVLNNNDFRAAWGELEKTGSVQEWQWVQKSAHLATYVQTKYVEMEDGSRFDCSTKSAIKVWPPQSAAP